MAKNSVKESPRPIENKTTERVIERSNVDKEWVESLIKRIEDIENKREENSKAQLDLTRTELEYLKKDREKLKDEIKRSEETRKELDKRYAETEIRNRRLEKYLAMDETMVDYYKRKRSPWDLVWRSSLFPGWGHRYAREDFVGNTYTTIFLLFIPVGYLIEYQTHAARQIVKDKLIDDVIIRPYSLQSLTGGTVPASFSPTGAFTVKSYIDYNSTMNALDDQERLGQNFYNAAILIYLAQIVHSYFTGVEWAKKEPRDYSNESLKTSRIDFKFKNDPWAGQFTGMGITIKF
jgi:hypothetical protein